MKMLTLHEITRTYKNNGNHAEQLVAYRLTKEIRLHDNMPFNEGSDIPEFHMSVKSAGATLMSGRFCTSTVKEEIIDEFFNNTASSLFAYVVDDFSVAYVMNAREFREFLNLFSCTCRDSMKNGGKTKVQLYKDSKRMMMWFAEGVA